MKKKELTEYDYKCFENFYYPIENKNEEKVKSEEEEFIKDLCIGYLRYFKSDVKIVSFGNLNQDDKITWNSIILLKDNQKYVKVPLVQYIKRGQEFENQFNNIFY